MSSGSYQAMLKLFEMPSRDYKKFMNFLVAHDCQVDFREFRVPASKSRHSAPELSVPVDPAMPPVSELPISGVRDVLPYSASSY